MIGRPLRYRGIPPEAARQGMVQRGFPEVFADGFLTLQNQNVGQPAFISGEVDYPGGSQHAEFEADRRQRSRSPAGSPQTVRAVAGGEGIAAGALTFAANL
jgi:hypothetical protein